MSEIYLFAATRWEVSGSLYQLPNTSVIVTGIGMRQAYQTARKHLNAQKKSTPLLISMGISGGTHESLHPFDIVLANAARRIIHSKNWQTQTEFSFPQRNLSSYHGTFFNSSCIVWGQTGSVEFPLFFPYAKKNLGESCAVCAVDMESFSIAQVSRECQLPFLAIRIILDEIREPLCGWKPWEFPRRLFQAREILGRFITTFLRNECVPFF